MQVWTLTRATGESALGKIVAFIEEQDLTLAGVSVDGKMEKEGEDECSGVGVRLRNRKQMDFLDQMAQWCCQAAG